MKENDKLKLLVLGLDGADFEMVKDLAGQGKLPNMKRIMEEGCWGKLRSTIPPVTAPAWTSFMTGKNPGAHGIFHWRTYDPTLYTCMNEELVSTKLFAGTTFWDHLGREGYTSGIITVPVTYPVWPLRGIMVAGYPCPDGELNYTYPESFAGKLKRSYNFQADYYFRTAEKDIVSNGLEMLRERTSLAKEMIVTECLDVCVLVLGEIDRAQHDFWKYRDPRFPAYHTAEGERFRHVIEEHYRVADEQLGRLLAVVTEEITVIVMSDHGGGPHPMRYFNTNAWLSHIGMLKIKEEKAGLNILLQGLISWARNHFPYEEKLRRLLPDRFVHKVRGINLGISSVDWSSTKAYRFPMYHPAEGIEINMKGRQPEGIVEPGREFEEAREAIIDQLKEARDPASGARIVEAVYRHEEIYRGRHMEITPDIVFLTTPGYKAEKDLSGSFVRDVPLDVLECYNGLHTMDGIFLARGEGIRREGRIEGAEIADIAPTILYAVKAKIARDMDGRILREIFTDTFLEENQAVFFEPDPVSPLQIDDISNEDKEIMKDKLKGLGYLS